MCNMGTMGVEDNRDWGRVRCEAEGVRRKKCEEPVGYAAPLILDPWSLPRKPSTVHRPRPLTNRHHIDDADQYQDRQYPHVKREDLELGAVEGPDDDLQRDDADGGGDDEADQQGAEADVA